MKVREEIFLDRSLPILEEASRRVRFKHIVSFSEMMPEKFKASLLEANEKYDFLVLDERRPNRTPLSVEDVAREMLPAPAPFGSFRLDDDDLVASNFFDRMVEYIRPEYVGMQISFPLGITALYDEGKIVAPRTFYYPMIAIGLLSVNEIRADGSLHQVKAGPHEKSDRFNPVVLDSREYGFLRFEHVHQDTALNRGHDSTEDLILARLHRAPGVPESVDLPVLFPSIAAELVSNDFAVLGGAEKSVESPAYFRFPLKLRSFALAIDCSFSDEVDGKDFLISFDIVDSRGDKVNSPTRIAGLGQSSNSAVGFYVYAPIHKGRAVETVRVVLPRGLYCQGIALQRWRRSSSVWTLFNISVRRS